MKIEIESSGYYITDSGEVYSRRGNKLCPVLNHKGYLTVKIFYEKGKYKTKFVHRLVAEAFIENPNNLETVNHKNGVKTDNTKDNLEWMSRLDNTKHAANVLQAQKGDKATNLTINSDIAREICKLLEKDMRNIDISVLLNVPKNIVRDIRIRKTWTHLSKEYKFSISKHARNVKTSSRKCSTTIESIG
jgi:TATA-binding protein-associated factor Taf7